MYLKIFLHILLISIFALLVSCESMDNPHIAAFNPKAIQPLHVKKEKISIRGKRNYRLNGDFFQVEHYRDDYHQKGLASWYVGNKVDSPTAINEIYDPHLLTAAHRSLPLPCYAKVTNLDNGRSIIVRINDRGPYIPNRIIDLSYGAAYKLGMLKKGLALVQIDTLNHGDDINIPNTSLKFGPFSDAKLRRKIQAKFNTKTTLVNDKNQKYSLIIGPFTSQIQLDRARVYLRKINNNHVNLKTIRSTHLKKLHV